MYMAANSNSKALPHQTYTLTDMPQPTRPQPQLTTPKPTTQPYSQETKPNQAQKVIYISPRLTR